MRNAPPGYAHILRVQWICAAADRLLGLDVLQSLPAMLSGFGSVTDHPASGEFASAAHSLRLLGAGAGSETELRHAVSDALTWEEDHRGDPDYLEPPYAIDGASKRLQFRLREGAGAQAAQMVSDLLSTPAYRRQTLGMPDCARPVRVPLAAGDGAQSVSVNLSCLHDLPLPPVHDLSAPPRGPVTVTFAELLDTAREMDRRDAATPGRTPGNWEARLADPMGIPRFEMLVPDRAAGTLNPVGDFVLEGLTHLIGLPGTGKTTIIVALLVLLDRRGLRTAVLLPSIEACLNMLGDLQHYGTNAGLLVGQSPQTRISHARRFAERVGADDSRGFGRTAPGGDLLGLTCALGGFDEDPESHDGFPHLAPPCSGLRQRPVNADGRPAKRDAPYLCPLGAVCGRLKAPRDLTSRSVWLGHILSLDTRIGPHFSASQMRYFDAVASACDVVVVDEADAAQQALDAKAISALDLTGSPDSYDHVLNRDLFAPMAAGRNDATALNMQGYRATAADFGKLNHHLVVHLQQSARRDGAEGVLARFRDAFTTGNNVVTELFAPGDLTRLSAECRLAEDARLTAIRIFWDAAVEAALFRRTESDDDIEMDPARVGAELGVGPETVAAAGPVSRTRCATGCPNPSRPSGTRFSARRGRRCSRCARRGRTFRPGSRRNCSGS